MLFVQSPGLVLKPYIKRILYVIPFREPALTVTTRVGWALQTQAAPRVINNPIAS